MIQCRTLHIHLIDSHGGTIEMEQHTGGVVPATGNRVERLRSSSAVQHNQYLQQDDHHRQRSQQLQRGVGVHNHRSGVARRLLHEPAQHRRPVQYASARADPDRVVSELPVRAPECRRLVFGDLHHAYCWFYCDDTDDYSAGSVLPPHAAASSCHAAAAFSTDLIIVPAVIVLQLQTILEISGTYTDFRF